MRLDKAKLFGKLGKGKWGRGTGKKEPDKGLEVFATGINNQRDLRTA